MWSYWAPCSVMGFSLFAALSPGCTPSFRVGMVVMPGQPTPTAQVTCPNCGVPLLVLSRVWPCHVAICDTGYDHGPDTAWRHRARRQCGVGKRQETGLLRPKRGTTPCRDA